MCRDSGVRSWVFLLVWDQKDIGSVLGQEVEGSPEMKFLSGFLWVAVVLSVLQGIGGKEEDAADQAIQNWTSLADIAANISGMLANIIHKKPLSTAKSVSQTEYDEVVEDMTATQTTLQAVCTEYGLGVQSIIGTVRLLKDFISQIDQLLAAGGQCANNQAKLATAKFTAESIRNGVKPLLPDRRKLGRKICNSAGKVKKMMDNVINLMPENGCVTETKKRRRNKTKPKKKGRQDDRICRRFSFVSARYEAGLVIWLPRLESAATDIAQAAALTPTLTAAVTDIAATLAAASSGTCLPAF